MHGRVSTLNMWIVDTYWYWQKWELLGGACFQQHISNIVNLFVVVQYLKSKSIIKWIADAENAKIIVKGTNIGSS